MRPHIFSTLLSMLNSGSEDYEEIVLQHYSHAESVHVPPIYHHGESSVYCAEEWVILDQSRRSDEELGRGPTEEAAWENAAKTIAYPPSAEEEAA